MLFRNLFDRDVTGGKNTTGRKRKGRKARQLAFRSQLTRTLELEALEDRRLLTIDLAGVPDWIEQGSQPITESSADAPPNDPSSGGVEDIAIDPNDPSHMFAATINGGIWRTHDGNRPFNGLDDGGGAGADDPLEQPSWTPLTDQYASLAMGGIAFDPLDATGNTVFAGSGSTSSRAEEYGGQAIGVFRTADDGATWSVLPLNPWCAEPRIRVVLPTTYDTTDDPAVVQVVLVATVGDGLYRSTDAGETYTRISNSGVGLPAGTVTDIIVDPSDDDVYYAGVVGDGVFRSDDGGASWASVNNADLSTNATLGASTAVMLTAHPGAGPTRVYAMISYNDDDAGAPEVPQVFTSTDAGANWTELAAVTAGFESGFGSLYDTRASDQIIVDPGDEEIVYIAKGYGGSPMVLRYDPSGAGSWDQIEDVGSVGNTHPHVDHRDFQFVNSGGDNVLIDANDGGLYFLVDPQNTPGGWVGLHGSGTGGLGATEYTNVTWDSTFNVVLGGSQDNGTSVQTGAGSRIWTGFRCCDGGDVQVDTVNAPGGDVYRYTSMQDFELKRHRFDSATNQPVGSVDLVPAGGLAGFDNYFVPQYELNSVNPSRLVTGGQDDDGGTPADNPVYELTNADSAPSAAGATWVAVPVGAGFTRVNNNDDACFVVGGRMGGADNEEVLIVGSNDDVFIRSTAGGTLTVTPTPFPGGTIEAVATDPENWQHIFVADGSGVWETTDAGVSIWNPLTRNLGTVNSRLQSLAYVPTPGEDVILVGGNFGVSRLRLGDPDAQWTRLGANLPNALVNDLEYHASDDVLLAGTFGRGAWKIENASLVVDDPPVLNITGDEDYVNQDDVIRLVRNMANPLMLDVFLNSVAPVFTAPLAVIQQINVFGLGGNDQLIVDASNGLISVFDGIRFDGGSGFDRVDVEQTGGTARTNETVAIGADPGRGRHTLDGQMLDFENIEPFTTNVAVANFAISSVPGIASVLDDDNQINYEVGQILGATAGRVTVDNFEPIEFINKTTLVIDAGAGSDQINLHNGSQPTSLTTITVNGNDPTASDAVIVSGTAGLDNIVVDQFTNDGARIVGAQPVTVVVDTAEHLQIVGQGGDDNLTVVGTADDERFVHAPGAAPDAGWVRVMNETTGESLLPVEYLNLGATAGSVEIDGGGEAVVDTLVAEGTAGDNTFNVAATSGIVSLNQAAGQHVPVVPTNLETLIMSGLGGVDLAMATLPQPYDTIFFEGGSLADGNRLQLVGELGADETSEVFPSSEENFAVVAPGTTFVGIGVPLLDVFGQEVSGDNDDLVIHDDTADNVWELDAGNLLSSAAVQIDDLATIQFTGFDDVELENGPVAPMGIDLFRVHPTFLSAAFNLLTITGSGDDTLEMIGTDFVDNVTSTATTVDFNGTSVTFTGLDQLEVLTGDDDDTIDLDLTATVDKVIDAGAGDDLVDLSDATDATIFGGLGNDTLIGTPLADLIDGGLGNDTIIGGPGSDDLFGNDGSDLFIWNQGDGSDLIEGDVGQDELLFNGADVGTLPVEDFLLQAVSSAFGPLVGDRLELSRTQGGVVLDMAGVETVDILGDTGDENFVVDDLHMTDVQVVNLDFDDLAGNDTETVTIEGRTIADDIEVSISAFGNVVTEGLRYDVNVFDTDPGNDILTINGNENDDNIKAEDGVEAFISIVLDGGPGDDFLSADATLNGGPGNDFLEGGSGDDTLNGDAGEDTMVGGGGDDIFDGGADFDTILISGTSGNDVIDVVEDFGFNPNVRLTHTVNGVTENDEVVVDANGDASVERARIVAGDGADLIRVQVADEFYNDPGTNFGLSMIMDVHGGANLASSNPSLNGDRLVVVDNEADDLVLYRKGVSDDEGTVTVGPANAEPFENVFAGIERVQFVDETGAAINQEPGNLSRLVVFKHDPFEYNDDRFVATHIGANETVNADPTIDPGAITTPFNVPGDADWYRVEAEVTGTLDFQVFFEEAGTLASGRPGLPDDGNLDIFVYDVSGDLVAPRAATPIYGGNDGGGDNPELDVDGDVFAENERIRIPAVQGQVYYLRIVGNGNAINNYTMTIVNHAPPTPFDLELVDNPVGDDTLNDVPNNSDTGRSQFDNVTRDNTPTIIFRLDDGIFLQDLPGNSTPDTPPDEVIPIPFRAGPTQPTTTGYAIAIFDEGNLAPAAGNGGNLEVQEPLGFATQIEDGLYTFTVPAGVSLDDGSHFLTARVQMIDPASPQRNGWGDRSQSLEIVVDIVEPPVFFGLQSDTTDGLHPDSDTGIVWQPESHDDRITADTTPTFWGLAEADTIVRLFVDTNGNGALNLGTDVFIGETVAVPYDGTNQFGNATGDHNNGQWELTSTIDMNDADLLVSLVAGGQLAAGDRDGIRNILAIAEDVAGNVSSPPVELEIFIDTQGARITDVEINALNDPYDLFDPKPSEDGPTPLVNSLVVSIEDLPDRAANWLYAALKTHPEAVTDWTTGNSTGTFVPDLGLDPAFFSVVGDANGNIPIGRVMFTSDGNLATAAINPLTAGQPATGYITIDFTSPGADGIFGTLDDVLRPLPDDRFTLTINDDLMDYAGNKLDGESHAVEPHEIVEFPTGDGIPGGDFVARFTVDSRPELGVFHSGSVWVDTNGNFSHDPDNPDFTNRDITYVMAVTTDDVFAGDFAPLVDNPATPGVDERIADGFDKLAAYGRIGSNFRWLIDMDNDGVPEDLDLDGIVGHVDPLGINGLPVAGNFDNNVANGDEVGLLAGGTWYFDGDHTYTMGTPGDIVFNSSLRGFPIVGDFNGDTWDDLGTWQDDEFTFQLATGPQSWSNTVHTLEFGFIGVRERPIAADFDQDGIDDVGLRVPDREGVYPTEAGEWYVLVSGGETITDRIASENGVAQFEPVPFGHDMHAVFGDEFAVPVVGNFDPPVTPVNASSWAIGNTNPDDPYDVNGDGYITTLDVLIVISQIDRDGSGRLGSLQSIVGPYVDTYKDGILSPLDVLAVVGAINDQYANAAGEGEQASVAVDAPAVEQIVPEAESISQLMTVDFVAVPTDASPETALDSPIANNVDTYFAADNDDQVSAREAILFEDDLVDAVLDNHTAYEDDSPSELDAALDLESALSDIAADVSLAMNGDEE